MILKEGDVNMKRFCCVVVLICVIVLCSGCSLDFFSVESLIVPPEQSGKNGEVQKAFNTLMSGTKFQLKTPTDGDYQTSFVLTDINADGIEEAFVFYTDSSSVESSARMAYMECIDDEWSISSDIKGAGTGVKDVNFVDLNNDGVQEVFVSWSLLEGKTTNIVSVFELVSSKNKNFVLNSLGNEYCNDKTYVDFNNDGTKDFVLVYIDDSGAVFKPVLRMFTLTEKNKLYKYGETVLDSSIMSIVSIQSDVALINNKKSTRIFIDCAKNDRMIFTELVYWDEGLLVPRKALTQPAISNLRSNLLLSSDIDNDGLLEIPSLTKLYGDEKMFSVKNDTDIYTFTLVNWNNVIGDDSRDVYTTLLNPMDKYLLLFDWGDEVTVKYDYLRKELLFCKWDEANKRIGDELFSIAFREEVAENEILGELLYETEDGNYYYQITEDGYKLGITDKSIVSLFIKLS